MRRVRHFAPAAVWALFILWLGSLPSLTAPDVGLPLDKLAHFCLFAVLGALLAYGLDRARIAASLAWPLLAGILIGTLDELRQRSVEGRTAEWADLMADAAGCTLALYLTHHALQRWAARRAARAAGPGTEPSSRQEDRA